MYCVYLSFEVSIVVKTQGLSPTSVIYALIGHSYSPWPVSFTLHLYTCHFSSFINFYVQDGGSMFFWIYPAVLQYYNDISLITFHNLHCGLWWNAELIQDPPGLHNRNSDLGTDPPHLHYSGSATRHTAALSKTKHTSQCNINVFKLLCYPVY